MSNDIVNKVTENTAYIRTGVAYPYILVENATAALAVLMDSLDEGDLPICVSYKDNTHVLDKRVSKIPTNLIKLIKVYPITFCLSDTEKYQITTMKELLDLDIW